MINEKQQNLKENNINEKIIESLLSIHEAEKIYAINDIADQGLLDLVPVLITMLKHEKSMAVKNTLIESLRKLENSTCYPQIFECFLEEDAFIRNAAVTIMSNYNEIAVEFLTSKMPDYDKEIRKLILDTIAAIGGNQALFTIRSCLNDRDINVVITAIEYLGVLKDKNSASDILQILIENEEPMLCTAILEVMPIIANADIIKKIMYIIIERSKGEDIDPIYMPNILMLTGSLGDIDEIIRLTKNMRNYLNYSDDIMRSIMIAKENYRDKAKYKNDLSNISHLLVKIANNPLIEKSIQMNALEVISDIEDPMIHVFIRSMMDKSDNEELKIYCSRLLTKRGE